MHNAVEEMRDQTSRIQSVLNVLWCNPEFFPGYPHHRNWSIQSADIRSVDICAGQADFDKLGSFANLFLDKVLETNESGQAAFVADPR